MTWLDRRLRRFGGRFRIPEVRGQNAAPEGRGERVAELFVSTRLDRNLSRGSPSEQDA